jgi:hypothetical protein
MRLANVLIQSLPNTTGAAEPVPGLRRRTKLQQIGTLLQDPFERGPWQ